MFVKLKVFVKINPKILKLILLPVFAALFLFVREYKPYLFTGFFQSDEAAGNFYRSARALQQSNDFKTAFYTYNRIAGKYKLYDVVLFREAECAAALEDEKTAIEKYKQLLKAFSHSPVAPMASYGLGQAYLRVGEQQKAEKQFNFTAKKFADTDYALGSFYYLAELNKTKDRNLAIQYWLKYITVVPEGRFATESIDGLKSINYTLSPKDKKLVGIALFTQQNYRSALEYLNQLPINESWYWRAMCHKRLGNRGAAAALFETGIKNRFYSDMDDSKIRDAMLSYTELCNSRQDDCWQNILSWTDKARDFALYKRAQLLPPDKAKGFYEQIYKYYSKGDYASDALWNLFWQACDKGDYDSAISLGKKHISAFKNTAASPAVHFWLGKIYEKRNNYGEAKRFYKIILKTFPDSYYAFRANGRLNALKGGSDNWWRTSPEIRLSSETEQGKFPYSYKEISEKYGTHPAELILLGDYDTALLLMKKDPFFESWVKLHQGMTTSSIVIARNAMGALSDKPNKDNPCWKIIYPIQYSEEINRNARLNNLDPVIVLSLMKEESHFNPDARSSSDARGLMQLLPGTANDIARWKRLGNVNGRELFTPAVNIKLGTAYLSFTEGTFNGNVMFSVAAYNAGPGAVQAWLRTLPRDDMDRFVENIPYSQTKTYVKKVFGTYWNYRRIYDF